MPSFTRKQMYELVWSEPRTQLAKRMSVSDVWIGKACRKADIPVPPPGYWACHRARQQALKRALPPRGLGKSDTVYIGTNPHRPIRPNDPIEIPEELKDLASEDAVQSQAASLLSKAKLPKGLSPINQGLVPILEDEERRTKTYAEHPYEWNRPRFDSAEGQRMLKIVNGLLHLTRQAGCSGSFDKDEFKLIIQVGDTTLHFQLQGSGIKPPQGKHTFSERSKVKLSKPNMELAFCAFHVKPEREIVWRDQEQLPLQKQIRAIALDILVLGEMQFRARTASHRNWLIGLLRQREEDALKKKLEQEQAAEREAARREFARRAHLESLANQLAASDRIRLLVTEISAHQPASPEVEAWRDWALRVAHELDPRHMPVVELLIPPDLDKSDLYRHTISNSQAHLLSGSPVFKSSRLYCKLIQFTASLAMAS